MVAGLSLALGAVETVLLAGSAGAPYRAICPQTVTVSPGASQDEVNAALNNSIILAQVTLEENSRDTVTATKNPVELGAAITDHSFLEPAELILRVGWSDSGNYDGYVNDVYAALLNIKNQRQFVDVYTGKRFYQNMLLLDLTTMTDQKSEYSLLVTARFEQVIVATTSVTTLPAVANQAIPQSTAAPVNSGTQQVQTPSSQDLSAFSRMGGAFNGPGN